MSLNSLRSLIASSSTLFELDRISTEPTRKLMPLIEPENFFSFSGSGQPLFSGGPATSGHLSLTSGTPSPSWSGLGQPFEPYLPCGSLGHLSSLSGMPSPSLSGSGQPSASWKPSKSSGSLGHLSALSGMPSPSLSTSGHPSSSRYPSLSSGSRVH